MTARAPEKVEREPEIAPLSPLGAWGGAETCFNALDDNDNRLIDEGCGVAQSEVQFVLAWKEPKADFDLYVSDPEDQLAVADGTTNLGLTLSADCPPEKKSCHGQNYENVYLEQSDPAPGIYKVRVRLEVKPVELDSIEAVLGVRLPTGTLARQMKFYAEAQELFVEFEVPELEEKKQKGKPAPEKD